MHIFLLFIVKYLYLVVIAVAGIYWLLQSREERLRLVVFGLIAGVVSLCLVKIGAAVYFDPRPFVVHAVTPIVPHVADNGFPSDHTVLTACIALTLFSSSKRFGITLAALAVLIGIGRVIGHIHSPIDIVGSLAFAGMAGAAAYFLTPKLLPHVRTMIGAR